MSIRRIRSSLTLAKHQRKRSGALESGPPDNFLDWNMRLDETSRSDVTGRRRAEFPQPSKTSK
jgi:hypothetical protein